MVSSEIDDHGNGPSVSYPVKGLLQDIRDEQRTFNTEIKMMLGGKADKADVERVHDRLDRHDERLGDLERTNSVREGGLSFREKALATLISLAIVAAPFIASHIH